MPSDSSPLDPAEDPSRSVRRAILFSAAVFMLLISGVVGYWIWQSHAMVTQRAYDVARSFSLTYKAYTEQVLANIQGTLVEVASLQDASTLLAHVDDMSAFLNLRRRQMPTIRELLVTNQGGEPVLWTGADSPPDLRSILAGLDRDAPLSATSWVSPVFSDPLAAGAQTFLVTHTMRDDDGRPRGMVMALVDQARFASTFGTILETEQASVALVHYDGTLMARQPAVPGTVGQTLSTVANRSPPGPIRTARVITSPVDGFKRIISERGTDGYPLIVGVTVTLESALAPWRRGTAWALGLLALAGAGIAGLTYQLIRQVRLQANAQIALQRQNTVLAAQQETSTDGIVVVDANRRILSWNRRFPDLWGVPTSLLENGHGDTLREAIRPLVVDPDDFNERILSLYAHPDEDDIDGTEVRLRNGCILERYSRALRNTQGKAWGRVWFYRDVTQRRRDEQALRESEQRFRDVANAADEFIWEVDTAGRLTFVTERATDFLGYSVQEMLGQSPLAFIHPEDRTWVSTLIQDANAHRAKYTIGDYRIINRDGDIIWLRTQGVPMLDEQGRLRGYRGASMNSNDIKIRELDMQDANRRLEDQAATLVALAEQLDSSNREIRRVQERFDLAMRGTTDGIYDWDLAADTIYLSPRWCDMLGLGRDEAQVTPAFWTERIHPEDYLDSVRALSEHLHGMTRQYRHAHRMRHQSGGYLWVLDRARAVRDQQGLPVRLVGTHVDITEMRRYEEALRQAKIEAEHANAAKSRFLAVMSHEIRTPMTGVLGMTDLLLGSNLDDRQHSFAQTAKRSAETLLSLLNDILDFSKIEAGQLVLEEVDFNVADTVDDVVDLLRINASEKGLIVSVAHQVTPPEAVRGDPHRLRQVLFNLVGNAIKFTERGEVVVGLERYDTDQDVIRLHFAVRDTGIGLSEDQCARLFQPFIQADDSTTRRFGGTGLGLAICKRLVEAMDGDITVASRLGEGSTFRFSIRTAPGDPTRLMKPATRNRAPAGAGHLRPPPGTRLLLAEDTPANRLLIATVLERMGFEVDQVTDGWEAVQAVRADSHRHALVLMDMQMPVMDGVTATRAIRAMPDPPPIVGLTADALRENHETYLAAGLLEILIKPVDWPRLETALITHARNVDWRTTDPDPADKPGPEADTAPEASQPSLPSAPAASNPGQSDEPPHDTVPLFDPSRLDTLSDHIGEGRILPIVRSMLGNMDSQIQTLATAIENGDDDEVRRTGHTLKGLAGQFGAVRLAWLGERIQDHPPQPHPRDDSILAVLSAQAASTATETRTAVNGWLNARGMEPQDD